MKKIIGVAIIMGGMFLSIPNTTQAQVIIKIKPPTPKVVVKPNSPKSHYVWIPGHWNWNKKRHKYVWVSGHWSKPKKGKAWVPGHYKKVRGGYQWIPGHWKRK